jgi:hypothetical protein
MSLSLPNVLTAEEIKVICNEPNMSNGGNKKSASGDNLIEQIDTTRTELYDNDNLSQGSYKLNDHESDITTSSVDPRISNTRFTTKRIGNVIVKKVTRKLFNHKK